MDRSIEQIVAPWVEPARKNPSQGLQSYVLPPRISHPAFEPKDGILSHTRPPNSATQV